MNNSRRNFVKRVTAATAAAALAPTLSALAAEPSKGVSGLIFSQGKLPYAYPALEPHIDALTMEIHYTRHHAAYVKNVNEALVAEGVAYATEDELFANISKVSVKVRNNGGGAWNHNFFWESMAPGKSITGKVTDALAGSFGSVEKFKELFTQAAMTRFGSGWAWLIKKDGKLSIGSTPNQDNPLMDVSEVKGTPLLAVDVWEHAYYLKYQNKRNEYLAAWWNVVDWEALTRRLG
jgi:Fe-Mn family superoxide dismutase